MIQQVTHVTILDEQRCKNAENISIRRCVSDLVLVYPYTDPENAIALEQWFEETGLSVRAVSVDPNNFESTLSSILRAIDDHRMDKHTIEFNIACRNPIMIIAACMAAMILRAPILSLSDAEYPELIEVRPSEIANLTIQKRFILEHLSLQPDSVNQVDLASEIKISRSNVSRHIRDLERAGYVIRWRNGREKLVKITDLGLTVLYHKLLRKRRFWGPIEVRSAEVCTSAG